MIVPISSKSDTKVSQQVAATLKELFRTERQVLDGSKSF